MTDDNEQLGKSLLFGILFIGGIGAILAAVMVGGGKYNEHQRKVREEGVRSGRMHVHQYGPWSEPFTPWKSVYSRQYRTCTNCGEATERFVD